MSEKIHIEKGSVQETLIIPLFSRTICNEKFSDFFTDPGAESIVSSLDYDFEGARKNVGGVAASFGSLEVGARQKAFMYEIENYLKSHPKCSIINLGCGLDQTAERFDNGECRIYNIDFPDVIEIRNTMIPPGNEREVNIPADLNDHSWMERVERDNGAVFMASGVFYYFTMEEMQALVNAMASYFKGGILVFDIAGKKTVQMIIKGWIKQMKIEGVRTSFYVNTVEKDINPWLRNAKASSRGYMTGYFNLKEFKSIPSFFRLLSKIGDHMMKMKIVKIDFDR